MHIRTLAVLLLAAIISAPSLAAQETVPLDSTALHAAVAARDSALFDAFNRCDATALSEFFTDDLEFYHDRAGLISSRTTFIEGFALGCSRNEVGRREIDASNLEVHRMRGIGALAIGTHRFFVRTADGEKPGDIARFAMLWRQVGEQWKVWRVLSFDHRDQRYVGANR